MNAVCINFVMSQYSSILQDESITMNEKTEEYYDEIHNKAEEFLKEFKTLVRKYVPKYDNSAELLDLMQERTSVFSPYIWSD